MKLIIDTEKSTVEIDGKNISAIYDVHGEIDLVFCRKIDCAENTVLDLYKEHPAPVGKLILSISPIFAVEREHFPKKEDKDL